MADRAGPTGGRAEAAGQRAGAAAERAGGLGRRPVLVACAHGTRDPAGRATVARLWLAAAAGRPGLEVLPAYVDVQSPALDRTLSELARAGRESVVVPLLLSGGYHVYVDIAAAVARTPGAVAARPLGPSPLLVEALVDRLREVGARPADGVVLAAAGSSDARAVADVTEVAGELSRRRSGTVLPAYLSAATPTVTDAIAALQREHDRVVVASYLLAPGFFADRLSVLAAAAGAAAVSAPLGDHPRLAALLLQRYDEALAAPLPAAR